MAEDLRDKRVQILKDSGTREEAICALRTLLSRALKDGEKRETILTKMEELRKSASDEQEDFLLEVMVVLGGADAALMRSYEGRLGEFARPRLTSGYGRFCCKTH